MKLIATIFISALFSLSAFAAGGDNIKKADGDMKPVANTGAKATWSISGSVVDKKNNESLAGVAILVGGKKVYTDLEGHFELPVLNPGKYAVKVELISYETVETQIDVQSNSDLNIGLLQK